MLRFYRIVLKLYTRIVGISGKSSRGDSWKERECACHSRHFYWQEHWPDAVLMQNHKQIIAIHIRRSANSWEFSQLLPCCCPNNAFAPSKYPVSGQELKLIHWIICNHIYPVTQCVRLSLTVDFKGLYALPVQPPNHPKQNNAHNCQSCRSCGKHAPALLHPLKQSGFHPQHGNQVCPDMGQQRAIEMAWDRKSVV